MANEDYILRKDAANAMCKFCGICNAVSYDGCEVFPQKLIDEIPTADVRPVKIGHYIPDDLGDFSCSECGEKYLDITKRFCPECGAELRRNEK